MAKIDGYRRIIGVRKPMSHETAFEDSIKRKARLKQLRLKLRRKGGGFTMGGSIQRNVQREGEIPKDCGDDRIATVTMPQKEAYDLICKALVIHKKGVKVQTMHHIGTRLATIQALMKLRLISVKNGVITHYRNEREPAEILTDWNEQHEEKEI